MSVDIKRKKELSACQIPQLATRVQRRSNNVRYAKNRENGTIYDRFGNIRTSRCMFMP